MKKAVFSILLFATTQLSGWAQEDKYGATPEEQELCKQKLSLYREFRDQKNYNDAFKPWKEACSICPKSAKTLYIDGIKFYELKIKESKDAKEQQNLIDSMLAVYDARIEHFGQEGYVLGKKGVDMYKYRSNEPLKAFKVLQKAVSLTMEKTQPGVLDIYYRTMFEAFKKEEVSKEDLLTEYLTVAEYLNTGMNNAKEQYKTYYQKALDNVNEFFILVAACEDIAGIAKKQFEENPDDLETLKKLNKILTKRECTDSEIYLKIARKMNEAEPSHEASYAIALALLKKNQYGETLKYAKQALELLGEGPEQEDYLLAAASAAIGLGQQATTASYARKAAQINPQSGRAYLLIGDAIATSANSCGDNEFTRAAVYWLAVDYYQKARNADESVAGVANSKISAYRARFPDKKMLFQYGQMDSGGNVKKEPMQIGCWINESVIPRL